VEVRLSEPKPLLRAARMDVGELVDEGEWRGIIGSKNDYIFPELDWETGDGVVERHDGGAGKYGFRRPAAALLPYAHLQTVRRDCTSDLIAGCCGPMWLNCGPMWDICGWRMWADAVMKLLFPSSIN
jgi:hypothetical protein